MVLFELRLFLLRNFVSCIGGGWCGMDYGVFCLISWLVGWLIGVSGNINLPDRYFGMLVASVACDVTGVLLTNTQPQVQN